jgi:hypothetical protein
MLLEFVKRDATRHLGLVWDGYFHRHVYILSAGVVALELEKPELRAAGALVDVEDRPLLALEAEAMSGAERWGREDGSLPWSIERVEEIIVTCT